MTGQSLGGLKKEAEQTFFLNASSLITTSSILYYVYWTRHGQVLLKAIFISQTGQPWPTVSILLEKSPVILQLNNVDSGLFSFASTTLILSLYNLQTRGITAPNVVVGMAIFCGGLAQLLAGMWEFAAGNTFGATGEPRSMDFSSTTFFMAINLKPPFDNFLWFPNTNIDFHFSFLVLWCILDVLRHYSHSRERYC